MYMFNFDIPVILHGINKRAYAIGTGAYLGPVMCHLVTGLAYYMSFFLDSVSFQNALFTSTILKSLTSMIETLSLIESRTALVNA